MNEGKRPKYRVLPTSAWDDPKFQSLPSAAPCARYLLRFLELGPHTNAGVAGLFRLGPAAVAEALGWSTDETHRLLAKLEAAGLLEYDPTARVMFLPHVFSFDPPAGQKAVKGWRSVIAELPACALTRSAKARLLADLKALDTARAPHRRPEGEGPIADVAGFLVDTVSDTHPDTGSGGYGIPQPTTHDPQPTIHHPEKPSPSAAPPAPPLRLVADEVKKAKTTGKKRATPEEEACRKAVAAHYEAEQQRLTGKAFEWNGEKRKGVAALATACGNDAGEALRLIAAARARGAAGDKLLATGWMRPSLVASLVNELRHPAVLGQRAGHPLPAPSTALPDDTESILCPSEADRG